MKHQYQSILLSQSIAKQERKALSTPFTTWGCAYPMIVSLAFPQTANRVCAMYDKEGVVCPPKLSKQLFTVATVDNIDHNPSSTTDKD